MDVSEQPNPHDPIDPEIVERVCRQYPVELAVLFGSQVRGTHSAASDVDVAVAFEGARDASDRLEGRISLTVDLIDALGTDRVDVADLDAIDPAVGLSALRTGRRLVGSKTTADRYRRGFEQAVGGETTHDERMAAFDALLERLEGQV